MADIVGYIDSKVVSLLSLPISPGTPILLGESNIEHMKSEHPVDFEKYFSSLSAILAEPDFINLNPRDNSIKYIKQLDENVVVGVRISSKGKAFARTLFVFPPWKFEQFMTGGYLMEYK
ncbi:hypothetical protein SOV_51310 [Sporomusa ovata DSM 2662]|uniref:PBECR3 domain-containing polyvalent protein n=1 Tax=Sporomusa ovata TaxID=2378 RepID=UPI0003886583|nr:PBECR2 nuclease fold domain-containing protein [Sporomusa ovata]EQB27504.1 hypothetical protein SOV_2c04000 [Sporomusa ovata DSM 2662]